MYNLSLRPVCYLCCLVLLPFVFVACSGNDGEVPTPAPLVTVPVEDSSNSSPRPAGLGGSLPPTWTPMPTALPLSTPSAVGESAGTVPNPANELIYIVQAGDTLGHISEQFDVSIEEIARANNLSNIDIIEVGQQLIIPQP